MVAEVAGRTDSRLPIAPFQKIGSVRMLANGQIALARDVARRFTTDHLRAVGRGSNRVGLVSANNSEALGGGLLKLIPRSGGTRFVAARGILNALGKRRPERVIDLPFTWEDGRILVINLSALGGSEVPFNGR